MKNGTKFYSGLYYATMSVDASETPKDLLETVLHDYIMGSKAGFSEHKKVGSLDTPHSESVFLILAPSEREQQKKYLELFNRAKGNRVDGKPVEMKHIRKTPDLFSISPMTSPILKLATSWGSTTERLNMPIYNPIFA